MSLVLSLTSVGKVNAELMMNTSSDCADVVLLFARGSGQNREHKELSRPLGDEFSKLEKESYDFFNQNRHYINNNYPHISYKAVSVHDFPSKYNPVGYAAVPVGIGPDGCIGNTANAEVSWFPGDYRDSVQNGIEETTGYLKDQIQACPNQYYIVGGYSQGAQVMGESLFRLSQQERKKILAAGLFGDPKYIGSKDGVSYPWRRGSANADETGMLEARIPYVPTDMQYRTISWCNKLDVICGGWGAYQKSSSHGSYSENSIGYAVKELATMAAPELIERERSYGGISHDTPDGYISPGDKAKQRDVMFVLNQGSPSVGDTLKYRLDDVLPQFTDQFSTTRYGAKFFSESDYGFSLPSVYSVQPLLKLQGYNPSNPMSTSSNLRTAFSNALSSGMQTGGGGDLAVPYQLGLERTIAASNWSTDSSVERNIVLIVNLPPKDPYDYNICNGMVRATLSYPDKDGYKNCYTNFRRETWPTTVAPEACETVFMVITQSHCTNPLLTPSYTQTNKRSMKDITKLAQAYNVKISVVIPHKITDWYNDLSKASVREQLRQFAYQTGGTFMYYDQSTQYTPTLLYDTVYQVFTKQPRSLRLTNDNTDKFLGFNVGKTQTLDVSQSGIIAHSYRWDFDDDGTWDAVSHGPVYDHTFTQPKVGLMRVQALDSQGVVLAELRRAYEVTGLVDEVIVEQPGLPQGIVGLKQADGTTRLTWSPDTIGQLIITDPLTSLPVGTASLSDSSLILPGLYDNLILRAVIDNAISAPLNLAVSGPTQTDETLCYKLQQCNKESAPFLQAADTGSSSQSVSGRLSVATTAQAVSTHSTIGLSTGPQVAAAVTVSGNQTNPEQDTGHPGVAQGEPTNHLLALMLIAGLTLSFVFLAKRRHQRT